MPTSVGDVREAPPASGLVAGKYELLRLIGRGGMGSVWEARHSSLGTSFAIKFIDSEYAASSEARARFDNEARAAATIQSKHAIQIFDHGVTDEGRPYIVMEMLVGEPLDRRVERLGRISLTETARTLQQVCRALQRAHDSGIIHRDLKPENIFIVHSPDEDEEIAKVLDFGIAKIKPSPGAQGISSSTKTGAVMGTPYYMSPEQARGLRSVDHRSDLWSLGVIAFKCVTGVLPFEGESVGDLLVKICTSPVPTPSLTVEGLPPSFDAWFFRALEREPDKRFSSAHELAEGLAFACGMSFRRGGPSNVPSSAGAPALVASVAHAGPMSSAPQSHMQAGPALTASPFVNSTPVPAKSSRGMIWASSIVAALVGLSLGTFAIVKFVGSKPPAATSNVAAGGTSPANGATSAPTLDLPPLDPLAPAGTGNTTSPPSLTVPTFGINPIKPATSTSSSAKPPASTPAPSTTAPATTTTTPPPPPPPATHPTATTKPTRDPGY